MIARDKSDARAVAADLLGRDLTAWSRGAAGSAAGAVCVVGFAGQMRRLHPAMVDGDSAIPTLVLVEEDPVHADRLRSAFAGDAAQISIPAVVVIERPFAEASAELAESLDPGAPVLVYLDPPSARALPLTALLPWLRRPATDVWIRVPVAELHRQAPYDRFPIADLPPYARRIVEGWSALLGDPRREWLARWRAAAADADYAAAEAAVVGAFETRLRTAAPNRTVRRLSVCAPTPSAESLHLFVATDDPVRALELNRAVRVARQAGVLPWPERSCTYVREERIGVLDLFAAAAVDAPERVRRVDLRRLAEDIAAAAAGRTTTVRELLHPFAEAELLLVEDVRRALGLLKRERRVRYRSLAADAELRFAAAGAVFPTLARRAPPAGVEPALPDLAPPDDAQQRSGGAPRPGSGAAPDPGQ